MRLASARFAQLSIGGLCLCAALCTLAGFASAQSVGSKHKLSQRSLPSQQPLVSVASARAAKRASPPPLTTDNWTGTAGDNNWNTSTNWSAGVPSSADAVTIGTATATVNISSSGATAGTLTLSNSGDLLNINNSTSLTMSGNITNNGQIDLNSTANLTELVLGANVTLSGGGTVTLSNNINNYIVGAATADTLTNQETIQGAGHIGNGLMTLVNSGTINANASAGMTIDANGGLTNTGTIEATGGTLLLYGTTVTNTGGTISDSGSILQMTGSTVTGGAVTLTGASTLQLNATTISGGTLTNSATGTIEMVAGTSVLGGTINNSAGGLVKIDNAAALTLQAGTYSQLGTVQENSSGNLTELIIGTSAGSQNVTLSGGTLTLSNNVNNYIVGGATTNTLTNAETISGAGQIGNGSLGLVNSGTINANGSSNIVINVSSLNFNNTGTIEAAGGTLTIEGPGTTFFTNDNQTTNTLTLGTYIANGNNIQWAAGSGGIKTLSANVTEENGGQLFNTTNSTNALAGLTSITSTGALTIGGVVFTDAGSFSNAGTLTILGGESFSVGSLTQISGGSLTAGTYVLDSNLNITGTAQTITTNAATLTLAGGTIENTSNSTNALAGLATNTGKLTIGGVSNNVSTTAASFSNTGTLTINSNDSLTAATLTQISGSTLSGGTFVLGGNLDLTTAGINITTNSSTLTLEGGTINSNGVNALLNLNKNTKTLTLANNANFTTTGNFNNTGTMTINSGSTFTVISTGTLTNYNSSTNTLTGGTYSLAGKLAVAGLNIINDAANVTLNGTGEFENSTGSTNGMANLTTIASTGSLTLATNANFTALTNFTNSGKLTINSGSTFGVTGTLTNLSSGTLTGGTYTVGGTLQLASANGGITTNAANLTLTGKTAKIMDGTSNALSTFNNNTGTFALASSATLTTASSNFTNSGTVNVAKGTTLTVGGTGHSYSQTAGTTNADGTLSAGTSGTVSLTGGTIQGAGTVKGNTTNTSGTFSAGDAGKAGLLTITGTYTQLSGATLNSNIGGTTVSTQYSQLKISGTASLGGTLAVTLINSFTPAIGNTFTVLTATSVTGTFTNTTIAINSSEHFVISYTSTSVVLTVVSGPASVSGSTGAQPAAALAVADPKKSVQSTSKSTAVSAKNTLRHAVRGISKRVQVASLGHGLVPVSTAIHAAPRIWEHVPVTASWDHVKAVSIVQAPRVNLGSPRPDLAHHVNNWTGTSHAVPVQPPLAGWSGITNTHRLPVRIVQPTIPMIR